MGGPAFSRWLSRKSPSILVSCVEEKHDELADSLPCAEGEFIFLRLNVFREYLERELTMASLPLTFDVERSTDDWVFMCFFVGNDFLPHLPSLEIRTVLEDDRKKRERE
ncbi:5'-3' exoribonuclease 2-like isoform X2 [Diceros bicornis minor]|uniref:5'-3' exoribonuclease 2-like isoform X2 n=1 Tax=Diceros bicornis minor TaxID=77932 RepID=UPI0026EE3F07|nr:5'-3' exoribonuclease 2-like isoform X2 [Diceros bicornis minor]XP_058393190.1 5'-3' exoribonuclease 2-like isoform X2 [Diceros bicornis minor]